MRLVFLIALVPLCFGQQQPSKDRLPTDMLNEQLPKWLHFSGEQRFRLEGFRHQAYQPTANDLYLLHRFRLTTTIQPVHWMKAVVQVQDARALWRNQTPAPPYQDTWDLRLGYGEFGELGKSRIAVRAGRQEILLGATERLIGVANWSNTTRYFDAVRAAAVHGKLRLDVFSGALVVLRDGQVGSPDKGSMIHGAYGSIGGVIPGGTLEPYFLWRVQPRVRTESGPVGTLDMKVSGFRWYGKARAFDYDSTLILERGLVGHDSVDAWAGYWMAGYAFAKTRWQPRVYGEFTFAAGDGDPRDGQRNGFELLYTNAHDRLGLSDQIGWKNIEQTRIGVQLKLNSRLTLAPSHNLYWLNNAQDALYTWQGAVIARSASGAAGRWVGQETDVFGAYHINGYMDFGAGVAHIAPGTFLKLTTPGRHLTFPYLMLSTRF